CRADLSVVTSEMKKPIRPCLFRSTAEDCGESRPRPPPRSPSPVVGDADGLAAIPTSEANHDVALLLPRSTTSRKRSGQGLLDEVKQNECPCRFPSFVVSCRQDETHSSGQNRRKKAKS